MFIQNAWYVAAWSNEISDQPFARRLLNIPIVLYRTSDGSPVALEDRCCHRGAALSKGCVIGDNLQCGYHGLLFNAQGTCIEIPGQARIPPSAKVRNYPIHEQDSLIWIWMGAAELADPHNIPAFPYHNDARAWPHQSTTFNVKCNYRLIIDNLLDLTHLAYVHKTTIGGNPQAHVNAQFNITRKENGVYFIRWLLDCLPPPTYVSMVGFKQNVDRWMEFEFFSPGAIHQFTGALLANTGAYDQGLREGGFALRIFHGITPETEHSSHYFWSAAHGFRQNEADVTQKLFDAISLAFREDEEMLESQYERHLAFPDGALLDIKHDAARIHANQVLDDLLAQEAALPVEPSASSRASSAA